MYGAILGDMIGAPYEFDRGAKVKDFPLFSASSHFTDDSVMTVAVAEALMATLGKDEKVVKMVLIDAMQRWGRKYPDAGYGARFQLWLEKINPNPYGSYGNGSAMRGRLALRQSGRNAARRALDGGSDAQPSGRREGRGGCRECDLSGANRR